MILPRRHYTQYITTMFITQFMYNHFIIICFVLIIIGIILLYKNMILQLSLRASCH